MAIEDSGIFFEKLNLPDLTYPIILIEGCLGVLLILGQFKRIIFYISIFVLTIFTVFGFWAFYSGKISDCGCFGKFSFLNAINLSGFLIKNIILIGFGGIALVLDKGISFQNNSRSSLIKLALVGVLIAFTLYFQNSSTSVGKKLQAFGVAENFSGKVFVFSPTCEHCINYAKNINSLSETENVLGLTADDVESQLDLFIVNNKVNYTIHTVDRKILKRYFKSIPIVLTAKDGIILDEKIISNEE